MNSYERIWQMIDELKAESESLNGSLEVEKAKNMVLLSECITSGLQVFLSKTMSF